MLLAQINQNHLSANTTTLNKVFFHLLPYWIESFLLSIPPFLAMM